ncbi:telomerase Cajal body protein 1-like isoform X7 [Manihot esculenta]|uniref:telomerase Cajal body protein 1-like isoform X7 n=1 Tax=Manihot esculenta TaxID=3983 RepID=UPI001CC3A4C8|nr:telomerase Cajal body protein 1-like isoform X7 [Manihot esculenta]
MTASDPVSCVFASTTRDHPIHLWDASSGLLRCTYRAYDAVDEITAAFSIAFNPAGTKIFDIHRPGREFEQYSTLQGNKEGQADMARGKGKEDARNADRGVLTGTGRGRGRGDPEIVRGRGIITTAPSSVDFRAPTLTPTTPVSYLAPAAPPLAPAADSSNA